MTSFVVPRAQPRSAPPLAETSSPGGPLPQWAPRSAAKYSAVPPVAQPRPQYGTVPEWCRGVGTTKEVLGPRIYSIGFRISRISY